MALSHCSFRITEAFKGATDKYKLKINQPGEYRDDELH